MKVSLTAAQQNQLFGALQQMDAQDITVGEGDKIQIVRVPFKIGAHRLSVAKNINALRASLVAFEDGRSALVKELWPQLEEGKTVTEHDDPATFATYKAELTKMLGVTQEFDLAPIPAAVVQSNDFPIAVLMALDEHGLISVE